MSQAIRPPNDPVPYSSTSSDSPQFYSSNSPDMIIPDKFKSKNFVLLVEISSPPKKAEDDSSVNSNGSFYSDESFLIYFIPSVKKPENKETECIFCNETFSKDQREKVGRSGASECSVTMITLLWNIISDNNKLDLSWRVLVMHRFPTALGRQDNEKATSRRILFSDEAHFWLNGYVNKQNCRIWSEANPQVYVETPLHPEKLTVWCALWAGGILLQKR
ncbi:putative transposable element [Trichonephila clavipes]|nr:putative transposable element [Trichonephila clavipes]